jgi:lipopolysaccharide transport system ATP-binding protein
MFSDPQATAMNDGQAETPVIQLRGLSKRYRIFDRPLDRLKQSLRPQRTYHKDFWALRDIDLDVSAGTSLGVLGRNGSGKSTLLQLICGTLTPTAGDIAVRGRVAALLELGSGFNPEYSGIENIYLNGSLHGLSRRTIQARLDSILAFADIGDYAQQPIKTYSSGMVVRLAFSVIAHVDADILVIDEALAVGDVYFTQKCARFLQRFREQGTLLFVSHDMEAVKALCDRAALLEAGRLRLLGTTKSVTETYFAEAMGGLGDSRSADDGGERLDPWFVPSASTRAWYDIRQQQLGEDHFASLQQVSSFQEAIGSDGAGLESSLPAVTISDVALIDPRSGAAVRHFLGGFTYKLLIRCRCHRNLPQPDVGFCLNDRTGQVLFGDNTNLLAERAPWQEGHDYDVSFVFDFPLLRVGDYTITAAVQEHGGDQPHVLTWIHDALLIHTSHSSTGMGLSGVPMRSVEVSDLQTAADPLPLGPPDLSPQEELCNRDLAFRIAMTTSCRDSDPIAKVKQAGQRCSDPESGEAIQVMHNGLKVVAGGYYGDWMAQIIEDLRGHHEPQEEVVFERLLQRLGPEATMVELGSFWSYYSLWFLHQSPQGRRAICLEADPEHLAIGRRNAELNGLAPSFVNGFAARLPSEGPVSFPCERSGTIPLQAYSVPQLLAENGLERLDLLHADTQGAELEVLLGCADLLRQGRIRFLMVSTHSYEISGDALLHQRCLALIHQLGGNVICEHDVHESFSGDGLIAASFDPADADLQVTVSINRYGSSLFPNPAYYVPRRPRLSLPS